MQSYKSILKETSILYSNEEIHKGIKNIAEEINQAIQGEFLYVLTVMNGALFFSAHLIPLLNYKIYQDYIHATRYGEKIHGGLVKWIKEPTDVIRDQNVLIIDDILDEGITLVEIIHQCKAIGARNVFYAVLFDKLLNREKIIKPTFSALNVPNKFVFGFGLDYKGFGRNLSDLHVIN